MTIKRIDLPHSASPTGGVTRLDLERAKVAVMADSVKYGRTGRDETSESGAAFDDVCERLITERNELAQRCTELEFENAKLQLTATHDDYAEDDANLHDALLRWRLMEDGMRTTVIREVQKLGLVVTAGMLRTISLTPPCVIQRRARR